MSAIIRPILDGKDVMISHEEFRSGADYSPDYADAMNYADIRKVGYGGIMRDHSEGAIHGTEAELHAAAAAEASERTDWAFKEQEHQRPTKLLCNAYREESLSIPEVEREAHQAFGVEPDPLDVLCEEENFFYEEPGQ